MAYKITSTDSEGIKILDDSGNYITFNSTQIKLNGTDYGVISKGYQKYTFAIRQSGTDAPTITEIKDDFELETPLTFTRTVAGNYVCPLSALGFVGSGVNWNLDFNGYLFLGNGVEHIMTVYFSSTNLWVITAENGTDKDSLLQNNYGAIISIRKTLS